MEDNRLPYFDKTKLSDFNVIEARGWVVDSMSRLEDRLKTKIVNYFEPNEADKFTQIVLNSSIINMGGKLKILLNFQLLDKSVVNDIRELNSIRNGFAHSVTGHQTSLTKSDKSVKIKETHNFLEVMNSQGIIKKKKMHIYLRDYHKLFYKVWDEL